MEVAASRSTPAKRSKREERARHREPRYALSAGVARDGLVKRVAWSCAVTDERVRHGVCADAFEASPGDALRTLGAGIAPGPQRGASTRARVAVGRVVAFVPGLELGIARVAELGACCAPHLGNTDVATIEALFAFVRAPA